MVMTHLAINIKMSFPLQLRDYQVHGCNWKNKNVDIVWYNRLVRDLAACCGGRKT